jgi:hypothetical protein
MPNVLTLASSVQCGHSGTVQTISGAKLEVDGQAVLLASSIEQKAIPPLACSILNDPQNTGAHGCLLVNAVTDGRSTKLFVGSDPVILESLKGETDGGHTSQQKSLPDLTATANQSKLVAP